MRGGSSTPVYPVSLVGNHTTSGWKYVISSAP